MAGNKGEQSPAGAQLTRLFEWLQQRGRLAVPGLAFVNGALLSLAFAPTNIFPLLFLTIPMMIAFVDRAGNGREAFSFGWWTGFGLFAVGLNWIGNSFAQQDAVPPALAPFAVLALSAMLSLYTGLAFLVARKLWFSGFMRVLLFAVVWTLFEVLRGVLFTGFPWHVIGSAWAEWLWVAQGAYWSTVYGLSLLTLLVCGSLACLLDRGRPVVQALRVGLPFLMLLAVAVAGYVRMEGARTHYHLGVSMRIVQANIPQREKWISYLIEDHFDRHMSLSRASDPEGKANGVRLLIWPETAVQRENFDREGSIHRWRMSKLLDYGSFAVTGAPRYRRVDGEYHYYNSLFAINSDADIYARYDKVHLVPFGEYLPFSGLFARIGLSQLVPGAGFTPGQKHQTIRLPGLPGFSPLICYEAIFSGAVTDANDRPEWLLNISNDAWFGYSSGPYQHLALSRMRAIEEGLPLVRSTPTGVSAVIDGLGRTLSSMPIGRSGVMDSPLPKAVAAPYLQSHIKIIILTAFCAVFVLVCIILVWSRRS